jgi:hypothetical protein
MTIEGSQQRAKQPKVEFYFNSKALLVTLAWIGLLALTDVFSWTLAPFQRFQSGSADRDAPLGGSFAEYSTPARFVPCRLLRLTG